MNDDSGDSDDSDDGISSDDSDEFDAGCSIHANGKAYDKCDGQDDVMVNSSLVYNKDQEELHIVFDHLHVLYTLTR